MEEDDGVGAVDRDDDEEDVADADKMVEDDLDDGTDSRTTVDELTVTDAVNDCDG